MAKTVFYSWQSDSPNSTNRGFIEKALGIAIKSLGQDLALQEALRDEPIELDKDTKGVPGTPPIVDAIFNKISECGVFLPDLTFVAQTASGRQIPNPNVLIEYGWALKSVTHSQIVPVMNTAFGDPTPISMPFDMRHLRNPITYHLEESADADTKTRVKNQLARNLQREIGLIITKGLVTKRGSVRPIFSPTQPTKNPSTFLHPGEFFQVESHAKDLSIPDVQRLFLRLIPSTPNSSFKTSLDALSVAQNGRLMPMQEKNGGRAWSNDRNKYGAFAHSEVDGKIVFFSQLFKTGEIWGIDAHGIDKNVCKSDGRVDFGYFPCVYLERVFLDSLENYLHLASGLLNLALPLKFIAGATDVEGYKMTAPRNMYYGGPYSKFPGRVVEQHIVFEGEIDEYRSNPADILLPFFEHLWEECGLKRPKMNHIQ